MASLIERIKNDDLCPSGRATCQAAVAAMRDMNALASLEGVDAATKARARKQLMEVVSEYRRQLKIQRAKRKKHTRG